MMPWDYTLQSWTTILSLPCWIYAILQRSPYHHKYLNISISIGLGLYIFPYIFGYFGELSISTLLSSIALAFHWPFLKLSKTHLLAIVAILLIVTHAFGGEAFISRYALIYQWGFGSYSIKVSLILLSVYAYMRDPTLLIYILSALAAWKGHWLSSTNIWDYLIDPVWLGLWGIQRLTKQRALTPLFNPSVK